ncbi:MAG: hypothetical protein Kow0069_11370 [Promethearchaeota archaeon]
MEASELAVRTHWRGTLVDLLRGRGVEIARDAPTGGEGGRRNLSHFHVRNKRLGTRFVVETALGFAAYRHAVSRAVSRMNATGSDAAVAVSFPGELAEAPLERVRELMDAASPYKAEVRFATRHQRRREVFAGTSLEELNQWVAALFCSPASKGVNLTKVIGMLREHVEALSSLLGKVDEDLTRTFLGSHETFGDVLGYGGSAGGTAGGDAEGSGSPRATPNLAAYLILNQLLFYVLLQEGVDGLPRLTAGNLRSLDHLRECFAAVLERDWRPIFGFDCSTYLSMAGDLSGEILSRLRRVLADLEEVGWPELSNEVLGTLFHEIIPPAVRKPAAAFYTGSQAGELLAWLAVDDFRVKVLDPACGSGSLLTAVYRRKRELIGEVRPFTGSDHERLVGSEITGLDVMPFAAHLAAVNLALMAPMRYTNRLRVGVADSTSLGPGSAVSGAPVGGPYDSSAGAGGDFRLERCGLVVMNPPFTRSETLAKIKPAADLGRGEGGFPRGWRAPRTYKALLRSRLSEYEKWINARMGLHAYFVLLADRFLEEGGRIAAVLPASVLRVESTRKVREFLLERYDLEYVVSRADKSAFSENTSLREVLLVARKRGEQPVDPGFSTKFVVLRLLPGEVAELRRLAGELKALEPEPGEWRVEHPSGEYAVEFVPRSAMEASVGNWFLPLTDSRDLLRHWVVLRDSRAVVPHSTAAPSREITRGVESPRPRWLKAFSVVDARHSSARDAWTFAKTSNGVVEVRPAGKNGTTGGEGAVAAEPVRIPAAALIPGIRSFKNASKLCVDDLRDFFLWDQFEGVRAFVSEGLGGRREVEPGDLDFMDAWRGNLRRRAGHLFHVRRVDLSAPGTRHLGFFSSESRAASKLLWVVKPAKGFSQKFLALWYCSSLHLLQVLVNRTETRGAFVEVSKYQFENFKVPDLRAAGEYHPLLAQTYNRTAQVEFPPLLVQLRTHFPALALIDDAFLQVLGFEARRERVAFGRELRQALALEIEMLSRMMRADK